MYYYLDKHATKDEIDYARKNKTFLTYIDEYDIFIGYENQIVDISGKVIIPITTNENLDSIISTITKHGGKAINSKADIQMIKNWPKYIETKRLVIPFKVDELKPPFECYLIENIGIDKNIWFRNISSGFEIETTMEDLLNPYGALRKTMEVYNNTYVVEEFKIFERNNFGKKQYRCFVLGGKVINASRMIDKNYHKVEKKVIDYAKRVVRNIPECFPKTFVLDLMITDGKVDILNIDLYETSRRYLYNSLFSNSELDLEHTNCNKLPAEKRNKAFAYLKEEEVDEIPNDYFAKTYYEYKECLQETNDICKLTYTD